VRTLSIPTAEVFEPLLASSRYKGAHGGRGSGKSRFFASQLVEYALVDRGFLGLCVREVQKSLADSAKRLLENTLTDLRLGEADGFKAYREVISTPGDGQFTFKGMNDQTAESVKSFEGYRVAWCEEAHTLSAQSLTLLRPTIREAGSELWFSWNRSRKADPIDRLLTGEGRPTGAIVVQANWRDNPWFPLELEQERRDDLRDRPDQYGHIWEGEYAKVTDGAYYAQQLAEARLSGRIGTVPADPLMQHRAFWDIGTRDHTAIWVAQFVGREIRVLDYYEASGQPLGTHLSWLRARGYGKALCVLPHDGANVNHVTAERFEDHIRQAGFEVNTVANQGKGAAMKRVEAARRLFPAIWFNATTTEGGLDALGAYHERQDERRGIGLGPNHDWASHGADAFGLMCVAYEEPQKARTDRAEKRAYSAGSWLE